MRIDEKLHGFEAERCILCEETTTEEMQADEKCKKLVNKESAEQTRGEKTMSTWDAHLKWGVTKRHAAKLCEMGRVPGAYKVHETWFIPEDAERPADGRVKSGKYINQKRKR